MKIEKIQIEKLYGKYDLSWNLNSDVNIIAGDNGSFKTTLLKIMASLCEPEKIADEYPIKGITMSMSDNIVLKFRCFRDSLLRLQKDAEKDELLMELATSVRAEIEGKDDSNLSDHTLNASIIAIKKDGKKMAISAYKKLRKYNHISTFDVPTIQNDGSVLDQQLEKLESEYAYYLSDLSKQLSLMIQQKGVVDKAQLTEIYAHNNLFIDIVNQAFANTRKTVNTAQSKLQFKIGDELLENTRRLSSGEKQFLIIMLATLLQRNEESVFLMDEPEISMHLDWQRNLISNIKLLNPNCQLIIATHSPGIIMDGWEQLVVNMSDLFTNSVGEDE